MTHTEQDNELRQKMQDIFNDCTSGWLITIKNFNGYERELGDMESEIIGDILDFITADRKRVALEEREKARKFYAKRKPQFTKTWAADVLGISRPTLDKWIANPEQFTIGAVKKLAELKAQQEEV